jgi:hypothetical protein
MRQTIPLVSDAFRAQWLSRIPGARLDAAGQYQARYDAAESVFVQRALLSIEAQPYNTLIPPLKGRQLVPTDNTSAAGAEYTVYRKYTRTGVARLIATRASDLPTVGLFVQEYSHRFYPIGAAYEYSYFDLLAVGVALANGQPINLDLEMSISAREAIEKKLDLIAGLGTAAAALAYSTELEEDAGLVGIANNPNASTYSLATGGTGSVLWSQKTPDEIIADLNGIVGYQVANTFEVHEPDTLVVSIAAYEQQLTRSMGDGRSDTILSYFLKTSPHIKKVEKWQYLTGIGNAGKDRMICYKRDPRMVRHMISMEATTLPPQQEDMMTRVPVVAKTAGVVIPYPLSITYADGYN